VLTVKIITDSASACSDKSQSPILKVYEPRPFGSPAWNASILRLGHPLPFHFLKSSWRSLLLKARFLGWNSEICRLPPYELEGNGGHGLWRNYWGVCQTWQCV